MSTFQVSVLLFGFVTPNTSSDCGINEEEVKLSYVLNVTCRSSGMQLRCSDWRPCGCMHCNGGLQWGARHHSRRHGGAAKWDWRPFSLLHRSALCACAQNQLIMHGQF